MPLKTTAANNKPEAASNKSWGALAIRLLAGAIVLKLVADAACASPYAGSVSEASRKLVLSKPIAHYEDVLFFEPVYDDGSLFGFDTDQDGVRDDVEHFIVARYPDRPEVRYYFYERTRLETANLVNRLDLKALQKDQPEYGNIISCLVEFFPGGENFGPAMDEYKSWFFNSATRKAAVREHAKTLAGTVGFGDNYRPTLDDCLKAVKYAEK